jgi:hypothetical protein
MRQLLLAVLETLPKERTFPPLAVHLMKWLSNETRRVALLGYISKLPQDSVVAVTKGVLARGPCQGLPQLVSSSVRALSVPHKLQILQPIFGKNLSEGRARVQSKHEKELAHAEIVEGAMSGMEFEDKIEALLLRSHGTGAGDTSKEGRRTSRGLAAKAVKMSKKGRRRSSLKKELGKWAVKPGGVSTIEMMTPDERGVLLSKCFLQTGAAGRQQLLSSVLAHEHQAVMQSRRLSRVVAGDPAIKRTGLGGTKFKLKSIVNQLVTQRESAVKLESPLLQAIGQLDLLEAAHLLGHLQQRQRVDGLSRMAGGGRQPASINGGRLSPQRLAESPSNEAGKKGGKGQFKGKKRAGGQSERPAGSAASQVDGMLVDDKTTISTFVSVARSAGAKSQHQKAVKQNRVSVCPRLSPHPLPSVLHA